MLALLADENSNADILRGLLDLEPSIDALTVADAALLRTPDPLVLEWAASHARVVLTHDVNTFVGHAYDRVRRALRMPGVIAVHGWCTVGRAIEDVALLAVCLDPREIDGQVRFVPM